MTTSRTEGKLEQEIRRLSQEIAWLGRFYDPASRRRLSHLQRKYRELTQGPGWTDKQWEALQKKYDYRCLSCLKKGLNLEPDHVVPIVLGGEHHITNIQPLCKPCNFKKNRVGYDHDFRPSNIRKWRREIRGRCIVGSAFPTRQCKNLALEDGKYCRVHQRQHEKEMRELAIELKRELAKARCSGDKHRAESLKAQVDSIAKYMPQDE